MSHDNSVTICLPGEGVHDLTQQPHINVSVDKKDTKVIEIATGPMGPTGYVDSGSLLVTASSDLNGILFTKGDGSTFSVATGMVYIDTANNMQSSSLQTLTIYDYDNVNSVSFSNNDLVLTLGTPNPPTAAITVTGFDTDRFNKQLDTYTVQASYSTTMYTIERVVILEDSTTIVDETESITNPLPISVTNSGSHTYHTIIYSRDPVSNTLTSDTKSVTRTLNKTQPGNPIITVSANVQLGIDNFKIEYGATGSIAFTTGYGPLNGWVGVTNYADQTSPIEVNQTSPYSIDAYAVYTNPPNANDPDLFVGKDAHNVYTRVKSLRVGHSTNDINYYLANDGANLLDIGAWQGTIYKSEGWVNPAGKTVVTTFNTEQWVYIVMDETYSLNGVSEAGAPPSLAFWNQYTAGGYRIYVTKYTINPPAGDNPYILLLS
jgi:hypothetical protein